jgi:hypothetical protein
MTQHDQIGGSMVALASEADIFSRVFDPVERNMSKEAAKTILKLDFSETDRERMNALAEKARNGALTPAEDEELESYIRVGHLISIMQSKARLALKNGPKDR